MSLWFGCDGVGDVGGDLVGARWGAWAKVWKGRWCNVCVSCEPGIFV